MRFELPAQAAQRVVVPREHQHTGYASIKSMNGTDDDTSTSIAPSVVIGNALDQRIRFAVRRGHGEPSRRLIDHDQMFVLEEDVESEVLWRPFFGAYRRASS